MAVKLSLGFQDEYSEGFQKLTAEMEEQERAAGKLKQASNEHSAALREMAREHENAARAMLKSKEASGSLSTKLSTVDKGAQSFGKSTDNAGFSLGALVGKMGAAAAAAKTLQVALASTGKSADGSIDNWVRLKTAASTTWETAIDLTKAAGREVRELLPELETTEKQLHSLAGPWKRAFGKQDLELVNKEIQDFQQNLQNTMQLQETLRQAGELRTQKEVQAALDAEMKKRESIKGTNLWTKEQKELSFQMESTLRNRMVEITRETEQKKKEAIEQATREAADMRKQALEREQQMRREWHEEEQKMREEARRIAEAHADSQREIMEDTERHAMEYWRNRLKDDKNGHEKLRKLERESAEFRHKIALETAKDEETVIRLQNQLARELRDIDHRAEMAADAQQVEAKRKAAQEEIDIERKKIDQIKGMRDAQNKNVFESLTGAQDPKKVQEALLQKRLAESRQEQPDLSRHQRQQQDRLIRRMTAQGRTQTGDKTSEAEVSRVQADLAANQTMQAAKTGKVSKETIKAMAEQAKEMKELADFQEEMAKQLGEIQEAGKSQQQRTRERTERLRAQRRAMRS